MARHFGGQPLGDTDFVYGSDSRYETSGLLILSLPSSDPGTVLHEIVCIYGDAVGV